MRNVLEGFRAKMRLCVIFRRDSKLFSWIRRTTDQINSNWSSNESNIEFWGRASYLGETINYFPEYDALCSTIKEFSAIFLSELLNKTCSFKIWAPNFLFLHFLSFITFLLSSSSFLFFFTFYTLILLQFSTPCYIHKKNLFACNSAYSSQFCFQFLFFIFLNFFCHIGPF